MDSTETISGHVHEFCFNTREILGLQSDKMDSLDVSSEKPDNEDLLSNNHGSPDNSNDNPDGTDYSNNKPAISDSYSGMPDIFTVACPTDFSSEKSDSNDIASGNVKEDTSDLLSDNQGMSDLPSNKRVVSVNSIDKSKESDLSSKNHGSIVFSSNEPGNRDFSSDKVWSDVFSNEKTRSGDFYMEKPWIGDYSGKKPGSEGFSSDKPGRDGFSSDKTWSGGYSNDKPGSCDLSKDRPCSLDLLKDKPDNPDASSANLEISCEVSVSRDLSDGKSSDPKSVTEESTNTSMSHSTENLVIEIPVLPNNVVESNGLISNDPNSCERSIQISGIHAVSCYNSKNVEVGNDSADTHTGAENSGYEKTLPLELCMRRLSEYSDIIERIESVATNSESYEIVALNSNEGGKNPLHTETSYEAMESHGNASEVTVADGKWEIVKCHQSSNVCVLKCLDEDTQYKFKCIYFNKGTKLHELFKSRTNDKLNFSQEEILECIDSIKDDQSNCIEDHVKSSDQSGFLEDRMGISIEITDAYLNCGDDKLIQSGIEGGTKIIKELLSNKVDIKPEDEQNLNGSALEEITKIIEELLSDQDINAEDEQNLNETPLDNKSQESEIIEDVIPNKAGINGKNMSSNELGEHLKTANNYETTGSKVQDISGYLSSTEATNDLITEIPDTGNQFYKFTIQQKMLNCVRILCESVFGLILCASSSFMYKIKSQSSTDSMTQTNPETVTIDDEFKLEPGFTSVEPSTSSSNIMTVPSESMRFKTRITNFSILFQHLSATAGTDMTAERVMKNIDSQVVMDIYNGFHELRIVDYGSVELMSKCIRGCIDTLQRTMSKSDAIVQRASVLLRKKTHTLEEMQKLNEDLKDLTSDAEIHLHEIDRALTGLEDFTEDFMYYKNAISKELVEFLFEDFPEIFK